MCEYCNGKNMLTIDCELAVYINQNKLKAITNIGEVRKNINYCPMCGRKLGEKK